MIRKIGMAASAAAMVLGGVAVVASPAFAGGKTPLGNAHGTVHCAITAKVKINPPLTNANTLPSTTTAKLKTVSCSSSGGTILGAIAKGKGSVLSVGTSPGTCTGLLTPGTTPFSSTINWKGNGVTLNPSTITFANVGPSGIGFNLPATGAAGAATTSISGSFSGEKAWAHANLSAVPDLASCLPGPPPKNKPAKGIKKLTISSGTLDIFP
jgi:hypothetical protein